MDALGAALAVVWIAGNLAATLSALLTTRLPRQTRLLYVLLAWAIPLLGAVVVLYLTNRRPPVLELKPPGTGNP